MIERGPVDIDQIQTGLDQTLERTNAGPLILRHKRGLFGGMGQIIPPDLRLDGDKGEVRLEYSLAYPPPRRDRIPPNIVISIGVSRSIETGEDLTYIDSDGQRIFQVGPNDLSEEELEEGINEALRDDFLRRLESGNLPPHIRDGIQKIALPER